MQNKKGFIFIETILTIVVLLTTLVLLYSSYSSTLLAEKRRLYYDDIAYVYKTYYIRDILNDTLDGAKFKTAVDNKREIMYLYVFNIESRIFKDNALITAAHEAINFTRLVYIQKDDVDKVKKCVNGDPIDGDDPSLCAETLKTIKGYADATFLDYMSAIDVPYNSGADGILIALIYETKNGSPKTNNGKYENCIQNKVFEYYGVRGAANELKQDALNEYHAASNINFDMYCENAYYNSWVYL